MFARNYYPSFAYLLESNNYINSVKINENIIENPCENHSNCSREPENVIISLMFYYYL